MTKKAVLMAMAMLPILAHANTEKLASQPLDKAEIVEHIKQVNAQHVSEIDFKFDSNKESDFVLAMTNTKKGEMTSRTSAE